MSSRNVSRRVTVAAELRSTPHADQYFGPLLIEARYLTALLSRLDGIAAGRQHLRRSRVRAAAGESSEEPSAILDADGIGTIELRGPITKYGSSLSSCGSSLLLTRLVRQWTDDPAVKGLFLVVDSPGGTAAGTPEFAAAVRNFTAVKPSVALIEDLGASAAYWLASQCGEVLATRGALVGSIGAYSVVEDTSAQADAKGIIVHVIRSAPGKGAGEWGTEFTDEDIAEWQRVVDASHGLFVADVAAGRGLDAAAVDGFADGRIYPAAEALAVGMIDGIATIDEARERVLGTPQPPAETQPETGTMAKKTAAKATAKTPAAKKKVPAASGKPAPKAAGRKAPRTAADQAAAEAEDEEEAATEDEQPADTEAEDGDEEAAASEGEEEASAEDDEEPVAEDPPPAEEDDDEEEAPAPPAGKKPAAKAATVAQLKAALPDSNAAFREQCVEKGRTLAQAKDAWMSVLRKKVAAASHGVKPLSRGAAGKVAEHDFLRKVEALKAAGKPHSEAVAAVAKRHPQLHRDYLDQVNGR